MHLKIVCMQISSQPLTNSVSVCRMCVLHVGVRACSYVALFLRTTTAASFHVRNSMFTRDRIGGCCVEFTRPFERELWSQLSVGPLASSFLVSSQTPCPSLPTSTCHFPLLKGTAPPRELRKRGFLHVKLKRGLSSCSRLLPWGVLSLLWVLVQSSENSYFLHVALTWKVHPFISSMRVGLWSMQGPHGVRECFNSFFICRSTWIYCVDSKISN